MFGVMVPSAFAETWYYYVEPLPDYASYANNVMELSTTAWEEANDNLQFIEVETWEQADFRVSWVKEFGGEHVGYAFGSWYVEVGLGDSNCGDGMWQPYSEKYVADIMTHEIGHVLGFEHVNDPNSIMYPTAINWEYGNVEVQETLTKGYGYFQPICTSKDVTTFNWHVSTDDPTYGFDVYFVPSVNEFDNWMEGEPFTYFNENGCFAENMLSVGGTCEGVTQDSGLLVIMGDNASEPLTEITLNLQENNFEIINNNIDSEKSSPNQNSNDIVVVDSTFSLYVDPQNKFSIKYPSNWIVFGTDFGNNKVEFRDENYWNARIYVIEYGEIGYADLSNSSILNKIISFEQEYCTDVTFADDNFICYDFELMGSDSIQKDSGQMVYVVGYENIVQYVEMQGVEYPMTTILAEIHDGSNAWTVYAEVTGEYRDSFGDILINSLATFEVNTSAVSTNTIGAVEESGFSQSCVDTGCYTPLTAVVNYGDTVTMTNTDPTGVHTFTSGTVNGFTPNPSQIFDSGVLMSGDTFQWQADVSGQVPYYCMLHTWMVGTIVVQEENSSTTNSIPIPIPTSQPDIVTSAGTAALSETSVNITPGQSEQIKIYGTINDVDKSTRVSITYTYPDGTTDGGTIFTTDTGVYETYLNLDKNSPSGNYEILVTAKGKILGTLILQVNDKKLESHPFENIETNPEIISQPITESITNVMPKSISESPLDEPLGIASFVDASKDPQHYIDRYNNEPAYKEWFDENYSQYSSIYEAVGLDEPVAVVEYSPEPEYIPEPTVEVTSTPNCGTGTYEKDGICVISPKVTENNNSEIKNNSKIKLIPGQWVEYDVSIKLDGSKAMVAMVENMFRKSLVDTDFDPFNIIKLRIEVLKVTDTFVEIKRTVSLVDDEVITVEKIDDFNQYAIFTQPFITYPASDIVFSHSDDNPFSLNSMNFKGEKKLTINKQKIPVLHYYGYSSSSFGDDTSTSIDNLNTQTSLAEYYYEKNTGILIKSKNEIAMFGIVPFLGEIDLEITFLMTMTDNYIPKEKSSKGGGCLIATATYGSEMSQQVQQLRELRDNQLMNTESGSAFMTTFNDIYYSFSPIIADYERENPYFKEAVKLAITPMISSLSLMENAESESEVLSIGISVIALNLGMYLGIPVIVIIGIKKIK